MGSTVSRGQLSPQEVIRLDEVLAHHDLPASSPHKTRPVPGLISACLGCGTVTEASAAPVIPGKTQEESADWYVDNYDFSHPECDSHVVIFHSSHRTLVDPLELRVIKGGDES